MLGARDFCDKAQVLGHGVTDRKGAQSLLAFGEQIAQVGQAQKGRLLARAGRDLFRACQPARLFQLRRPRQRFCWVIWAYQRE